MFKYWHFNLVVTWCFLYCLWVYRLLCSLGCYSETSLSVSWWWEEVIWRSPNKEADIITWSWFWHNIFSVAGAWVSLWVLICTAQVVLKSQSTFAYKNIDLLCCGAMWIEWRFGLKFIFIQRFCISILVKIYFVFWHAMRALFIL